MADQHLLRRKPFRLRGPDVVLREHIEHAGARHARDQCDVYRAQRDAGQDQVPQPFPHAVAKIPVSLHRQPVELNREGEDQDVGEHEHRNGETQHRERHHGAIEPRARLGRGDHAQRNRNQDRHHERAERERDGRLDALTDELRDRKIGEDRRAQIAVRQRPQPASELHQERVVEAEPGVNAPDVLVGRDVSGDDRGRIARRQIQKREHHERDDRHHDDSREQAPDDVRDHPPPSAASGCRPSTGSGRTVDENPLVVSLSNHERMHRYFFSTFHMSVIGAMITPERFVRYAVGRMNCAVGM